MKKIIIISYFFPPCAKAGAHRVYSMAEYLPRFDWQPIFIAPENGYYGRIPRIDNELLKVVNKFPIYRIPIVYPCNNSNVSLFCRSIRRLWETMLIPDGKILWNKEIRKRLKIIVTENRPKMFFITSTPFSSFLLAPFIKKEFGLPVVLDYRDPWASNPGVESNRIKAKLDLKFERQALTAADMITTASYHMIDYIKKTVGSITGSKQFFGFPYGYDGEFFKKEILQISRNKSEEKITATFAGSVHGDINHEVILEGIKSAINNDKEVGGKLDIKCYGTLFGYSKAPQELIKKYELTKYIALYPFLPYIEFLKILRKSSFLILPHGDSPIARVLYPTKLFDYLGVKRPILYIGGQGQVAETINDCNAGINTKSEPVAIAESLSTMLRKANEEKWYTQDSNYKELDRVNIFNEFCSKLNALC